ncbi:hypothetical protein C122C_1632 [Leuconostoc gelidum subsp. gasicomitatum]|uniref:YfhO family protein n=1 Tax=Leuconostoc gasicomitatum TaxID=115778 RepID=A0ABM9V7P7_9LACO|nr:MULTISPECIES: hypothetical protein [Leuconostoc gelidum group]MBZ6014491.1 hypothetical protein [Leuconostoc gelidum subsp. gelidum]CUW17474.1 hypothetical protein C122C_1632 [Leuconostoc gasicomitatum]
MNIKKTWLISFAVALLVAGIPIFELWCSQTVYSGADLQFHLNRIHEIVSQFQSGRVSLISYSSFNSVGSGVEYFYPSLTLIPAVLTFLVIKNAVMAYYISLLIYGVMTFAVAQYSFNSILKDKWLSTLSSVMFSLSAYRVFSIIGVSAFGEFLAIAWLPLIFLGYYRVIQRRSWRTLWIAMTLMAYTHLLSLLLTVVILIITTFIRLLLNYKSVIGELPYYIKAILSFSFSFLAFLVPFLILTKDNQIVSPDSVLHYQWAKSFAGYYVSSIRLLSTRTLGFVFVAALIGMFFMWHHFSKKTRLYFWIGIILTFISSSDFPWFIVEHSFISILQFPYRILPFAILFLTLGTVYGVNDITADSVIKERGYTKARVVIVLIMITMITTIVSVHKYKKSMDDTFKVEKVQTGHLNYTPFASYRVNQLTFDKQYNNSFNTYGAFDYWTALALKNKSTIISHKVLDSTGKPIFSKTILKKSGIGYDVINPTGQQLDLPFLKYNGVSYTVTVDGTPVESLLSKRGTLAVSVTKGHHVIRVSTKADKKFQVMLLVSIMATLVILVFPYIYRRS